MKTNLVKTIGGSVVTHCMATRMATCMAASMLAMLAPITAAADDLEKSFNRHSRLIGTWDVQVTTRDCQTTAALRTFPSILTYNIGGTMLEATAGIPAAAKTTGHGVWSHIRGNTYHIKFKSLLFDASGNFTGTITISQILNLTNRGNENESTGTVELNAPNGNLISAGCATSTATRFE